jgi:hypothetical protein
MPGVAFYHATTAFSAPQAFFEAESDPKMRIGRVARDLHYSGAKLSKSDFLSPQVLCGLRRMIGNE